MHEEATSISVPCSVAASTSQNENGTPTAALVSAEVDLDVATEVSVEENVDLQVPFPTNSGGKLLLECQSAICRLSEIGS